MTSTDTDVEHPLGRICGVDSSPGDGSISVASAMYARDLTCQTLGIHLVEVGPGRATMRMRVADTMVNGHGIAHGGFLFLLADAAFAYACNSYGPAAVAQHAQITFLRPARVGDDLVAEATERSRQGRSGIYDVTVRHADTGAVVAEFRGHSVLVPNLRAEEEHDG